MTTQKVTTSTGRSEGTETFKPTDLLPLIFRKSFGGTIWKTIKWNPYNVLHTNNIKRLCYNNTFVDYKIGKESCNDSLKLSSINACIPGKNEKHLLGKYQRETLRWLQSSSHWFFYHSPQWHDYNSPFSWYFSGQQEGDKNITEVSV